MDESLKMWGGAPYNDDFFSRPLLKLFSLQMARALSIGGTFWFPKYKYNMSTNNNLHLFFPTSQLPHLEWKSINCNVLQNEAFCPLSVFMCSRNVLYLTSSPHYSFCCPSGGPQAKPPSTHSLYNPPCKKAYKNSRVQ